MAATRGKLPVEDAIYNRLLDAVADKILRPGQHLNEVKLAEAYGVPRSRVRRVLERLRDEGIVTFELHRGAFLSRPTVEEAGHLFETRRHLEYAAVRIACERATAEDLQRLRDHLALERQAFADGRHDGNRVAGDFHSLLAAITSNPILQQTLTGLIRRGVLIQSTYERPEKVLCLTDEHEALIAAVEQRDAEAAVRLMAHHFDHILSSLELTKSRQDSVDLYSI